MGLKILAILLVFISFESKAQNPGLKNLVNVILAPLGSLVPDVIMDSKGTLHMVYAENQNAYYIRSTDNGKTFSSPVKVNSSGTVEYKMGERGPKLSVGLDGTIHVVWADHWSSGVNVYARYTRSIDRGRTFENLQTVSASPGVDGVSMAADGKNHVFVFWHTMVPVQTLVPDATWLHCARSVDNGVSFFADTKVVINNHSGLACSMCMTRARFGIDGKIYLVFRSAKDNIRDFYVLKGNALGGDFTAIRVNNDNWNINYCPMVGPELEIGNGGRQFCAFMSKGHVYWAVSNSDFTGFTQHVATPLNEVDELYPTAITNKSGQVLFVWQVGHMSVSGSAIVKWALYSSDGTFTGKQGDVGKTFAGTKATAFVGRDNNFYIIYNAEKLASNGHSQDNSNISLTANRVKGDLKISTIAGLKK